MLKNNFLTGLRNILKNKLISAFNIAGLSVAFSCVIVIFIFIEYNYSVDKFHVDGGHTFLVTHKQLNTGSDYGTSPTLLGPLLKSEAPNIGGMVRLQTENISVIGKSGEPFHEHVTFTDPGYFNFFDFTLKWGQPTALSDVSKVIISSEMAEKYFGRDNPLGEDLEFYFSDGRKISVSVAGVANAFPLKRSFDFDFLVNLQALDLDKVDNKQWSSHVDATFVKASTTQELKTVMEKFRVSYNTKNPTEQILSFNLEPLSTLASESYRIRNVITRGFGPPSGKLAFLIIGVLLMTLACLNYINTATALGVARLKEIGIRKVVGSSRSAIIIQFMMENLIIISSSLLLGILLSYFILLPGFASLFQINLTFEFGNFYFWLFMFFILIITALLSGAYPSLFISRYKPVSILSGVGKIGTKSVFSKILLSFQFMFSFIYIVVSLLFIANEYYQKKRDWGYNYKNLLVLQPRNSSAYTYIKNELEKRPDVEHAAGADQHIGSSYNEIFVQVDTTSSLKVHQFIVDSTYLETLGVEVVEGYSFAGKLKASAQSVIINEKFVKSANLKNPIGKAIRIDSVTYYVQGVVKDFRYTGFQRRIEPTLFMLSTSRSGYNYLVVRAHEGAMDGLVSSAKVAWKASLANLPYQGFQQVETIESYFILMSGHSKVMVFSAIVAVTLACLGLFGLVYLNIIARIRDYSIMKILGINTYSLIKQVTKIFIWFLVGAICVGFPSSLFLSNMLFRIVYSDYIPVTIVYPILGAVLLICMAGLTVSTIIMKLLKHNPIHTLRN